MECLFGSKCGQDDVTIGQRGEIWYYYNIAPTDKHVVSVCCRVGKVMNLNNKSCMCHMCHSENELDILRP